VIQIPVKRDKHTERERKEGKFTQKGKERTKEISLTRKRKREKHRKEKIH
jgi:hypothetical protein